MLGSHISVTPNTICHHRIQYVGYWVNAYSSAILPSSQRATVTIETFSDEISVTTVQLPAAVLIGWANGYAMIWLN